MPCLQASRMKSRLFLHVAFLPALLRQLSVSRPLSLVHTPGALWSRLFTNGRENQKLDSPLCISIFVWLVSSRRNDTSHSGRAGLWIELWVRGMESLPWSGTCPGVSSNIHSRPSSPAPTLQAWCLPILDRGASRLYQMFLQPSSPSDTPAFEL